MTIAIALVSARSYDHRDAHYAKARAAAGSTRHFRHLYRYIQVSSIGVAIASFWGTWPVLLIVFRSPVTTGVGCAAALVSLWLFVESKRALGRHYSPCFDAYLPEELVSTGPYRWIRHPIYSANIALLGSVFVATGSLWLALNCGLLWYYYWQAARREEAELLVAHPGYHTYVEASGRFLPRVGWRR